MFDPTKIAEALKQAQEMQGQFDETLRNKTAVGEAGAGMVKVTLNGKFEATSVEIAQELIEKQDKSFTENLVKAAVNAATKQLQQDVVAQAQGMMSKLNIFGGES